MIDPELLAFLNEHLFTIFEGTIAGDRDAYHEYYKLLFFETAEALYAAGVDEDQCKPAALSFLPLIERKVVPAALPEISSEGAFVWWRRELNALIYQHYRRERLAAKMRRHFAELTDREAEAVDCLLKSPGATMAPATFARIATHLASRYVVCTAHEVETLLRSAWRKLRPHFGADWPGELR